MITELIVNPDGTTEIIERELTEEEIAQYEREAEEQAARGPDTETIIDSMLIDHEYRLTLLELGITEMEV
jgi:hypothetical protein